ncbi:hydroxysqualene dehydroxylase HpnE [sulfur-oxidizing endosymbiont of Gigantopelta aegis]|uniref:hydroxysqualene dehydroxylase HpnE n=1 Tax=sulfur-oxidizing endosymbiont of Gigantopelta aegis TaxID=2794934 RepID=UPI0018DDE953|nr:hydroxysqualene dehydroxylase HpnE [sulfur-oxidizing endosymbiont of Gigantopelta aegis]
MKNTHDIIIVGAGWSGLACAITLAEQGYHVCILESAQQAGGRARGVQFKHFLPRQTLDNGQHIMLGAYHSTLALFKLIGVNTDIQLQHEALQLAMYTSKKQPSKHPYIHLKAASLPSPLHLLSGLMFMQGVSFSERLSLIKMALMLAIKRYKLKYDISVLQLLKQYAQSEKVIAALWEPLCLASLNTPIQYASAQVFLNVLKDSFSHKQSDSSLIFLKNNLSTLFTSPAIDFIKKHNGEIKYTEKVLQFSPTKYQSLIVTTSKQQYSCHTLILATPAHITNTLINAQSPISQQNILIPGHASLKFNYEPICTVYLQYPPDTELPSTMVGFFNTTIQWAIDRRLCNQAGLFAIVISASGKHESLANEALIALVHQELKLCLANLPELISSQVIIEKKATFSCVVGIENQRPDNETHIAGLYLAGDYTNTHYPATLESAIRSGQSAANKIMLSLYPSAKYR